MNDVSVVEVSHEHETNKGEGKSEEFLSIGVLLRVVQHRPQNVIDLEDQQKGHV
jgi:hypothetical protein